MVEYNGTFSTLFSLIINTSVGLFILQASEQAIEQLLKIREIREIELNP
jgi:hypothetical protein